MRKLVIAIADPAVQDVRRLIEELDAYMIPLYPAESNHLLDIEALRQPEMRFLRHSSETTTASGRLWVVADAGCTTAMPKSSACM